MRLTGVMVPLWVFALVAFQTSSTGLEKPTQSLFQQVIGQATGQNGYEEYVLAADILKHGSAGFYENWNPDQPEQTSFGSPAEEMLSHRLRTKSFFEVKKEEAFEFRRVIELVRQGNQKQVFEPRKLTPETLFPELASFKLIARFLSSAAYVQFANGNSSEGTRLLLDGLEFSYDISGSTLISSLVGIACSAILTARFEERLSSLSLRDAQAIQSTSSRILVAPIGLISAIKAEREFASGSMAALFKDGAQPTKEMDLGSSPDDEKISSEIQSASHDQRHKWNLALETDLGEIFSLLTSTMGKPEHEWLEVESSKQKIISQEADPIVRKIADMILPTYGQALLVAARQRTQLRLLGLHGRIIEYRWRTGKLPESLDNLADRKIFHDPLSNTDFVYKREGDGYRLFSNGTKDTGRIELRYRRPTNLTPSSPRVTQP